MTIHTKKAELIERINAELEGITIPPPFRVKTLNQCKKHLLTIGSNPNDIAEAIEAVIKLLKY